MPAEQIFVTDVEVVAIQLWAASLPDWERPGPHPEYPLLIELQDS
jgi:hypothetical protein